MFGEFMHTSSGGAALRMIADFWWLAHQFSQRLPHILDHSQPIRAHYQPARVLELTLVYIVPDIHTDVHTHMHHMEDMEDTDAEDTDTDTHHAGADVQGVDMILHVDVIVISFGGGRISVLKVRTNVIIVLNLFSPNLRRCSLRAAQYAIANDKAILVEFFEDRILDPDA
ncbi:hypothetical protein J6590_071033 [Homalodisca vitripennis]|nr:hypothetical protein J6590_071033 [Homalodisca vitripennis]